MPFAWSRSGAVGPLAVACALALAGPAHADTGVSAGLGFAFAAAVPDGPRKTQLGAPWYLRFEAAGVSRADDTPTEGDRPSRAHFSVHDALFVEGDLGAACDKSRCVSLGDVALRGVGGYELLLGLRAPGASVYVGPRITWEGWLTSKYALGAVSWPLVLRVEQAVARTRRRILSAWGSPHGLFRSYGGTWDEPLADAFWVSLSGGATRGILTSDRAGDATGALGVTVTLGVRVGSAL
jgi:hypothetical protein